jgi:hypothetical protein
VFSKSHGPGRRLVPRYRAADRSHRLLLLNLRTRLAMQRAKKAAPTMMSTLAITVRRKGPLLSHAAIRASRIASKPYYGPKLRPGKSGTPVYIALPPLECRFAGLAVCEIRGLWCPRFRNRLFLSLTRQESHGRTSSKGLEPSCSQRQKAANKTGPDSSKENQDFLTGSYIQTS